MCLQRLYVKLKQDVSKDVSMNREYMFQVRDRATSLGKLRSVEEMRCRARRLSVSSVRAISATPYAVLIAHQRCAIGSVDG